MSSFHTFRWLSQSARISNYNVHIHEVLSINIYGLNLKLQLGEVQRG